MSDRSGAQIDRYVVLNKPSLGGRGLKRSMEMFPVIIVGGGPVGLTTAILLAHHGVPSLVVERHTRLGIHPKARGANVRTMEILRAVGLAQRVRQSATALITSRYNLRVETLAGRELSRDSRPPASIHSPESLCSLTQAELEPLLCETAKELRCDVRLGHELVTQECS